MESISLNALHEMAKVQRRTLSAFGLVGLGAVVIGAGALYISYQIKKQFKVQDALLKRLKNEVQDLKVEVAGLKETIRATSSNQVVTIPRQQSRMPSDKKSNLDDDEYLTADDDDEVEEMEPSLQELGAASKPRTVEDWEPLFLAKIDKLLEDSADEQHRAYTILKDSKDKFANSSEFWWRLAKATHSEGTAAAGEGDKGDMKQLFDEAYGYAQRSLALNGDSANAHKWVAIVCGARSEFLGINDRIQSGYVFKEHVDRAISLNPTDSTCYYLLGRFCLEVSALSWIERKVAAALFSTPPSSTPEEAMTYFEKCESLRPFMDNRYYMAKCFYAQGKPEEALKWLDLATSIPAITATDKACLENVKALRAKLG